MHNQANHTRYISETESKHKNVKTFPSHTVPYAVLISISVALSQTPAYAARPQIQGMVCLFMPQLYPVQKYIAW